MAGMAEIRRIERWRQQGRQDFAGRWHKFAVVIPAVGGLVDDRDIGAAI
jgi:hypothetical protein